MTNPQYSDQYRDEVRPVQPAAGVPGAEPGGSRPPTGRGRKSADRATDPRARRPVAPSRLGGLWTALISGAIVLLLLLIFILENSQQVGIAYFGAHGHLPLGVALLLAAILGILLVVIPGVGRMVQLRMAARRHARRAQAAPGAAPPPGSQTPAQQAPVPQDWEQRSRPVPPNNASS